MLALAPCVSLRLSLSVLSYLQCLFVRSVRTHSYIAEERTSGARILRWRCSHSPVVIVRRDHYSPPFFFSFSDVVVALAIADTVLFEFARVEVQEAPTLGPPELLPAFWAAGANPLLVDWLPSSDFGSLHFMK